MKITTVTYIVRNTTDKEPIIQTFDERAAVNLAGKLNKKHNAEVAEVIKVTNITETEVL